MLDFTIDWNSKNYRRDTLALYDAFCSAVYCNGCGECPLYNECKYYEKNGDTEISIDMLNNALDEIIYEIDRNTYKDIETEYNAIIGTIDVDYGTSKNDSDYALIPML